MHSTAKQVLLFTISLLLCFNSCKPKHIAKAKDVVTDLSKMDGSVSENIQAMLSTAETANGLPSDSSYIPYFPVLNNYYTGELSIPVWSSRSKWNSSAEAMVSYIKNAHLQGLFKEDYGFSKIEKLKLLLDSDSLKRKDAVLWARADLLLTAALVGILKDLKQGRLQPDSLSLQYDTASYRTYFAVNIDRIKKGQIPDSVLDAVQPQHMGYKLLKSGIKSFADSMDMTVYTHHAARS